MDIFIEHPGVKTIDILRFVHVVSMIFEYPYRSLVQFLNCDRQGRIIVWLGWHVSLYILCAFILWKIQLPSKYIVNIYIFLLLVIIISDVFCFGYYSIMQYTVAILGGFFFFSTINSS